MGWGAEKATRYVLRMDALLGVVALDLASDWMQLTAGVVEDGEANINHRDGHPK